MTIQQLVENKSTLNYQELCTALIQTFGVTERVNWESILPAQQQQEYFGGETLKLIADHPILSKQQDIRPIALKKGSISQMLFFYVTLKNEALPKKNIQEVTKKFISGGDANRYIIWFFGNSKNTELKVVLSAKEGKKIVLKTLPFAADQPYYKTYNFILNEVSQNVNKLFVEPTDLWKALWKAFDISIVNRNFYNEIKAAFDSLTKEELPKAKQLFSDDEVKVQFAIRLIGRLIFCWFLKRKDIIKSDVLSSIAVKNHSNKNYYHDLLEVLFFDVFNTPDKERKAGLPKIIAHYPFLNGGLFEAQDNDYKDNFLLNISNEWFHNLFSKTLERYNFTVDENSSSNAEIAIDPEMLGRIFENLLAEQNPETGDSARKATGSFYTPREIVDYMVEQSVSEYLKTSLSFGEGKGEVMALAIEEFVHTQTLPQALEQHEQKLSDALAVIKVLDPACGSGAFPIGVLQKIVALKQQLHPKTKNYKLKLDTIQNSIYGVDIQPMAVELSRLRCWLSLVVDEEPTDIKALPNLDFKFVCADSLMEVGKIKQINIGNSAEKIEELKNLRAEFFIASGKRKIELEKKFKQIQTSLNNNFLEWDGKSKLVENLASWKPFDNHKTNWFDAFWMFGLNDGFDVVIANPPYGNIFKDKELFKKIKLAYKTAEYKIDAYTVFTESAQTFLSKAGVVCFITPYTFLSGIYFSKFRNFLNEFNLKQLVVLGKKVFEAAEVDTCIFILNNSNAKENVKIGDFRMSKSISELVDFVPTTLTQQELFADADNLILVTTKENLNVFIKICANKNPLLNYVEFYHGIQSRGDDAAIATTHVKGSMPLLKGKDFNKYIIYPDERYFIFKKENIKSGGNLDFHQAPEKIIIRTTSDKIISAIDTKQHLVLNSVNIAIPKSNDYSLKYFLAVLNSKLIDFWYQLSVQEPGKTFAEVKIVYLERIPIAEPKKNTDLLLQKLVDFIVLLKENENQNSINQSISNNSITKIFEEIIDGMVLELYFSEEMKAKKVNIIELVEKELEKAKSKDTAESIYNFYKAVSHPDSEIRNRIFSFALASPDILKPILQA